MKATIAILSIGLLALIVLVIYYKKQYDNRITAIVTLPEYTITARKK